MTGIVYSGSPIDAYMRDIGSPEDTINAAPRPLSPPLLGRAAFRTEPGRAARLESGTVTPNTVYDRLHNIIRPLPAELSFLVSSSITDEPIGKLLNPFADRLKRLVCSSLLLAGPGAALLHYSPPPRSLQRSTGVTASVSAIVITAIAALRSRPLWSIISVLAFIWTYYTSKVRRGETALTELQSKLLDKVEVLLHFAQNFDTSVQRAMNLVREVECVSRGWGLSNPLPPISRIEQASFGIGAAASETRDVDDPHALRAVDVRRVLQQSLRDARQMCKATCGVLERLIKGGEDGDELKGLYAAYGVAPEPVQLAALALSGKGPRPLSLSATSPGALRQRDRDSMRNSINRNQGRRLSIIPSIPVSPVHGQRDEALASPVKLTRVDSPPPLANAELESKRGSSRPSSMPRSARSSLFASRSSQNHDMDRNGAIHGPSGEDLSLATIDGAMELLHTDRQRTLCHLLAIDYEDSTAEQEECLQIATDAVSVLAERFRCGNEAIKTAAEREFGPDCLDAEAIPEEEEEVIGLPGQIPLPPWGQPHQTTMRPANLLDLLSSPRAMQSNETLRSFAPPLPAGHRETHHVDAFAERTNAMSLALRAVTAKLHVAGTDLRSTLSSPDELEDPTRIIKMHDSIRSDLEVLMREWDQSRVSLRQALLPPVPPSRPRQPPEPPAFADVPEISADEGLSEELDRRSSTISSELFTPVDRLSPELDSDEEVGPGKKVEEVFEAIGEPPARLTLSRSERIRLAQEKREQATRIVSRPDVHLIGELKDVLEELGRRR